jgi:DNA-binding IclR family transcriptional regulator
MTSRERDCLVAIARLSAGGIGPSYDEIAAALNLASKSGVARLIAALERDGLVARGAGARSIRLIADNPAYTPAALGALTPQALRRLIAAASSVLARKGGEGRDGASASLEARP